MNENEIEQALAVLRAESRRMKIQRWLGVLLLTCFLGFAGWSVAAPYVLNNNVVGDGTFSSSIASGNNAFSVTTNGARVDFGAGASDYCSSDGTTVAFAGPTSAVGITTSNGLILSGSGININNAGGYLAFNGTTQGGIVLSGITAASAGATAATAAHRIYVDNALGANDYVVSIGSAANAASLFAVDYEGDVFATGNIQAVGLYTNSVVSNIDVAEQLDLISQTQASTVSSTLPAVDVCSGVTLDANDLVFGVGGNVCATEQFSVDVEGDVMATGSYGLNGKMHWSATQPTISAGGCTSPSVTSGGDTASFLVNIGTSCTGVTTVTIGLPTSSRYWNCFANPSDPDTRRVQQEPNGSATTALLKSYSQTTGAALDWTASQTIQVSCVGGGF